MAKRGKRRRFGWVRKLPSGRFQASYLGPDDQRHYAPSTFKTETDAGQWLATVETDIIRGNWRNPELSAVTLDEYGQNWIAERRIRPRTRENYEDAWRLHIKPFLAKKKIGEISPQTVRCRRCGPRIDGLPPW